MSVWHNEKVKYLPRNIRTPSPPPYWNEHMNTSVHYPLSCSTILSNFMKKDLNYFVRQSKCAQLNTKHTQRFIININFTFFKRWVPVKYTLISNPIFFLISFPRCQSKTDNSHLSPSKGGHWGTKAQRKWGITSRKSGLSSLLPPSFLPSSIFLLVSLYLPFGTKW